MSFFVAVFTGLAPFIPVGRFPVAGRTAFLLSNGSYRSSRGSSILTSSQVTLFLGLAVAVLLRAVARDVASLTTSIARLSSSVEGSAVGRSAIARDVAKLATGVAFHSLGLAVAGKVVGASALVAGGRARSSAEARAGDKARVEAGAVNRGSPSSVGSRRVGAVPLY